jgi:hypothetical protein
MTTPPQDGPTDAHEGSDERDRAALRGARARATTLDTKLVRWLLLIVAAAAMAAFVTTLVGALSGPVAHLDVTAGGETSLAELAEVEVPVDATLELRPGGEGLRYVTPAPAGQRLLAAGPTLLVSLLFATGAILLAGIARDGAAGRPFAPGVSSRLTGLALVALAAAFLPSVIGGAAQAVLLEGTALIDGGPLTIVVVELQVTLVVLAGVVGVLDRAVRHGRALADDVEGLV